MFCMTERTPSQIFYGGSSVGDRHWITGRAYPLGVREYYDEKTSIVGTVDAHAIYEDGPAESWRVSLTDPPAGVTNCHSVEIASADRRYEDLTLAIENMLGRSALTIFVY